MAFVGLSAYTSGISGLQSVINYMNANGLNIHRLGFTPSWYPSTTHAVYSKSLIQYFLDRSPSSSIIVDRNHLIGRSEIPDKNVDFKNNRATAINDCIQICNDFPNNPRVIVELVNEYSIQSEYLSVIQPMVDQIRAAGYRNPLLVNKYENYAWSCLAFTDNNFVIGTHAYINIPRVDELNLLEQEMRDGLAFALPRGFKFINTEIGSANSSSEFSQANVDIINAFMAWSATQDVGNCVWTYTDVTSGYMNSYNAYGGLKFPPVGGTTYIFAHWQDGDTNPAKVINV